MRSPGFRYRDYRQITPHLTILRREPFNGETIVKCVKCYQRDHAEDYARSNVLDCMSRLLLDNTWCVTARCIVVQLYLNTRDSFYCHEVLNVRTEIEASRLYRAVRWGDYGQDHPAALHWPLRDHAAMLPPNVRMPRLLLDDPGGTMVPRTTNPSHAETIGWMIPGSILVQMNMNTRNSPSIVTKAPMYGPSVRIIHRESNRETMSRGTMLPRFTERSDAETIADDAQVYTRANILEHSGLSFYCHEGMDVRTEIHATTSILTGRTGPCHHAPPSHAEAISEIDAPASLVTRRLASYTHASRFTPPPIREAEHGGWRGSDFGASSREMLIFKLKSGEVPSTPSFIPSY
ncbi:hypothetical protein B0H11DRAFT_2221506 [Mycena galericulata]|nr:hypothetical protein B0H11DRAFT_2221506 [Mycena galericulata]